PKPKVVHKGTKEEEPDTDDADDADDDDASTEDFGDETGDTVWDKIAQCESGGDWHINTGNGYYGGLQFSLQTWRSVGGEGRPDQASRAEQIKRAKILQKRSGWGQWGCAHARFNRANRRYCVPPKSASWPMRSACARPRAGARTLSSTPIRSAGSCASPDAVTAITSPR